MIGYLIICTVFLVILVFLFFHNKHIPKLKISNVSELFCLFENNKTLPIGAKTRWELVGVVNGLRVWGKRLCCSVSVTPMSVVASCAQVGISAEIMSAVLMDSKTQKHWNCYLPKNSVIKTFALNPTMFEREAMYVEMKEMKLGKVLFEGCSRFLNKFLSKQKRINNIRNDLIRCWQEREDGGLWLVEHSVSFSRWVFYLVCPVADDTEESIVTVITSKSLFPPLKDFITSSSISSVDPTIIIAGLKDFIETKKPIFSPPLSFSQHPCKETFPNKAETNAAQLIKSSNAETGQEKEEISIFQKFKNLLEEKKEEQPRVKKTYDFSTPPSGSPQGPMDIIRRFSISTRLFEDKKQENSKEREVLSSTPPLSRWEVLSRAVYKDSKLLKSLHKTSDNVERSRLSRHLDSIIDNTAAAIINEKSKVSNMDIKASNEDQAMQTGGWIYCGLEKDTVILKKLQSDTQPYHSYMSKGLLPCPPKMVYEVLRNPENRMSYDDVIKKVEVLEECGSDMKIVRLLYEVGQNFRREKRGMVVVQGERMEGLKHMITMVSVDWPSLKAQYHGNDDDGEGGDDNENGKDLNNFGKYDSFFEDDSESTNKELNKKMNFDFYNNQLHNSSKNIMDEDCILDTMGASGWIVEPFMKGDNLCAMVTYVCQLSFAESSSHNKSLSQMAVDIALKQPLCLKHLRNYINTLPMAHSKMDLKGDGKTNVTLSLSNALAKFRNVQTVQEKEEEEEDYTDMGGDIN